MPTPRIALVCFTLVVACLWEGGAWSQTPLRVVAANITAGNNQLMTAESTRILQATDPDIVLIQEFNVAGSNTNTDIQNYVNSTLGPGFFVYREPGNQSIPNGIISRYPFIETGEWDDTRVPDRDHVWARIDIPGPIDLWAISVHLKAANSTTQNQQVQDILGFMAAKGIPTTDYIVFGGDLNTSSRNAAAVNTLAASTWQFVTVAPFPVGEDGDGDTNRGRTAPYDWVIPNPALNAVKTATVYLPRVNTTAMSRTYTNGLVFDTRDFTQAVLNEYFPPVLVADSNATNMQHQAVIRTFLIPAGPAPSGPTDNTVATVGSFASRIPTSVFASQLAPTASCVISVSSDEFDLSSVSFQRLGTATDADVPILRLYRDNNNNGLVDVGDALLGSGLFSAGSLNLALAPAPRATAANPIRLLAALEISSNPTNDNTVGLRFNANGMGASATGGNDPQPVFAPFSSDLATISNVPAPPPAQGAAAVVVNKFFNSGGSNGANDAIELLIVQDGLDLRGMIVKDYSSSMANDNGGRYILKNHPLWTNLRAGTVIVLRRSTSSADTSATGNDYNLDIGLDDTTYATLDSGVLDIAGTEMVTIKGSGTGVAGTTGNIHTLAAGTAGSQYTSAPQPKLRATTTAGTGMFCYVTSTGTGGNSRVINYQDGDGTALTASTGQTLGQPNTPENGTWITFLRGPQIGSASIGALTGTIDITWTALPSAISYNLEVSRSSDFTSFVPGYNGMDVGNVTATTISGLSDADYYIRVRGVNADGIASGTRGILTATLVPVALTGFGVE